MKQLSQNWYLHYEQITPTSTQYKKQHRYQSLSDSYNELQALFYTIMRRNKQRYAKESR